ncbi:uncharacterized protein K02A2.6-like [Lucilia sericata]|uniref:uncharacterized protein K02A2.6-like n=1 Tax=Lucilia sericata TaxID=13632 RepID=UPI0018A7F846|nr:uncharacterized protein K02A2.6-like [Lucilia sericata]
MTSLEQVVGQLLARQQEAMEKQHQLMERLIIATQGSTASNVSGSTTPSASVTAPEALMDILSKSIREFTYEPEENQIFGTWYERYEDVFQVEADQLDDAAKVRLLLRKVSNGVFNKYKDYLLPKQPSDVTFQQTVDILKKLFGRKESLFSTRVKCITNVKKEDEDIISYAAKVNRHCENFLINTCTADNFKCLILVNGLSSHKDQEYKARLLTLLESETEQNQLNLDNLVAEVERINSLKRDVSTKENPNVNIVHSSKQRTPQNANKDLKPRRSCWQCGNMHFVRDCGYTTHKCSQCGKVGHKEGFCSCFPDKKPNISKNNQQHQNKSNFKKTRKTIKSVYATTAACKNRRYISLQINNVNLSLQHDTGSDVTIISKKNWVKIGKPTLKISQHKPRDASTNEINIIGQFQCTVVINNQNQTCNILVSSLPDLNLFGSDLMEQFKLWNQPIDSYTSCKQLQVNNTLTESELRKTYPEVFRNEIGHCTHFKVHPQIKPQVVPVFRPKRQVAYAAKDQLDSEIQKLEREGIISPINFSEWAAPIVVVKKASGNLRICGDYSTGLNDQLEPHTFPLPLPDEIFINFNNCSIFSIIDLNNAYMQIEVDDDTKKLLVINTHRGLYTFNRLSPGVRSAPGAFQQCMESIISGIKGVFPYLDDVIVATPTREENIAAVKQYYGKFLHEMRMLRDPLDNLLKKNTAWSWSSSCQRSFERFKQLLSSDLLLTHFDPKLPIKVAADASNVGLGAYICHVFSLTPAEQNYSQIEKEGLALVFAVNKFHKYLFVRKFILQTDQKPLLSIFGNKKGIPAHSANRLQRWALTLMSYDFTLQYISTHEFGAADILSRLIFNVPKPNEDTIIACIQLEDDIKKVINDITNALPLTFNMICAATKKDSNLQDLIKFLQTAPYHPQSNGQAERFVDTLKRALKKLEGMGTASENLQTFLKCYRSSPNPSSGGKSPSELFVGRKIRINLDLLKKPTESQLQRNEKMEEQYNKRNGAKERIYNIGQKVYAKLYKLNKSEWFPAQQTPPRDQNMRDNEFEYVPLTDGQTTSTDELQPVQDPLLVTSPSGSTNVNSLPTTLEKLTSTLEEGASTSNSTTDPVVQTDEANFKCLIFVNGLSSHRLG